MASSVSAFTDSTAEMIYILVEWNTGFSSLVLYPIIRKPKLIPEIIHLFKEKLTERFENHWNLGPTSETDNIENLLFFIPLYQN